MKNFYLFCVFILNSLFLWGNPQNSPCFLEQEKTYVHLDQIHIDEEGIFVQIDNEWIPISGVYFDHSGLFIQNVELRGNPSSWVCSNCGTSNLRYKKVCVKCGVRRKGRY